jgi:hypothetical protein
VSAPDLPESQGVQLRLVTDPDAQVAPLYSNFVQVTLSPLDFTFHFGWYAIPPEPPAQLPANGTVDVPVTSVAKVSIPLGIVPAIRDLLDRQIEAWETNFGGNFPAQPAAASPTGAAASKEEDAP